MHYTYITRKQIGVIFANWKKGNLEEAQMLIKSGLKFYHVIYK